MNEELNVYNLPENTLYQYSKDGYFVWKVKRNSTLGGNYQSDTADVFTEVYSRSGDGKLICDWSGNLVENPSVYGKGGVNGENVFGIFDYDMDTIKEFRINMPLTKAPQEISSHLEIPEVKAKQI